MKTPIQLRRRAQAGVTLIEALVAMLIMAIGMLALIGLQSNLRRAGDVAKQRGEASQAAQADLEQNRDFSVIDATATPTTNVAAGDVGYNQLFTSTTPTQVTLSNVGPANSSGVYNLTRSLTPVAEPKMIWIDDNVTWTDRAGASASVEFGSIIAANDPALSGSLGIAPTNGTNSPTPGRAASIPPSAVGVGNGLSGFVPSPGSTVAWVFNNTTGVIVGICTNIPVNTPTSGLTVTMVSACTNNADALLLSGYVRYSFATPPDPNNPSDTAILPGIQLSVTSTGNPTPAYQCFVNIPSTNNTLATYYCSVFPNSKGIWSGQLSLTGIPLGWGKDRVCAYNGYLSSFSTSATQPFTYTGVNTSLTQQNFLVIQYSQSCPAGSPVNIAAGQFVNTSTVQIQP